MLVPNKILTVLLAAASLLIANDAFAQCSGRGAPTGRSTGSGSMAATPVTMSAFAMASGDAFARSYATQMRMQQMYQAQQRSLAMRQRAMERRTEEQLALQRELLANRRQRAQITREKRAERIAKAKAKREAQRYADKSSDDSSFEANSDTLVAFVD